MGGVAITPQRPFSLYIILMKEAVDPHTNNSWIQLSDEEIKIGFLSQCIEAVALAENCNYIEMLERMEAVNMAKGYILACYDTIHTLSWEMIVSDLRELLHKRESE